MYMNFILRISFQDDTALTHSIRLLNIDAVVGLLIGGADPNMTNRKGVTPISVAAHKGNIIIMTALIDAGANVNALNNSGSTALIQVQLYLTKNTIFISFASLIYIFVPGVPLWKYRGS